MMKTDTKNSMIEELKQVLSLEDSILGSLEPDSETESSKIVKGIKKESKKPILNNTILLDIINDQTKAKFIWQCITAFTLVLTITMSFMCFGLYKSRENLTEKLSAIKPLEKQLAESKAQTDKARVDLIKSSTELQSTQNELNNSNAEIKKLQGQLADVTQNLESLVARNAEAVKLLNGRLQRLSEQTDTASKH